jgi:hypothetical protein
MGRTRYHRVKPGSEGEKSNAFSHMQNLDLIYAYTYICICTYIYVIYISITVIMGMRDTGKGKEKDGGNKIEKTSCMKMAQGKPLKAVER